ncbi:MAG: UbiX family flavin prenyltransferase [Pseudomonadota bacterium]
MRRIILAISGASGMPIAATLLRALSLQKDIELHLIVSTAAELVLRHEHASPEHCAYAHADHVADRATEAVADCATESVADRATGSLAEPVTEHDDINQDVRALFTLAHMQHNIMDFSAGPASGSWRHDGMIVCPCSMSSLASIATGIGSNLIHRAADVTLKERRPLILVTRETPLSRVHLRNMLVAAEAGAIIMPPCPAFYTQPQSIQDILDHTAGRILDQVNVPHSLGKRWRDG